MNKLFLFVLLTFLLSACSTGTKVSAAGANVQVHEQNSNLLSNCRVVGPVNFRYNPDPLIVYVGGSRVDTISKAREIAAGMRADTLVVVNTQVENMGAVWSFQGVAMNCYGNRIIPSYQQAPEMVCQTDSDCANGSSCRSKNGGGTQCRVNK